MFHEDVVRLSIIKTLLGPALFYHKFCHWATTNISPDEQIYNLLHYLPLAPKLLRDMLTYFLRQNYEHTFKSKVGS